MIAHVTPHSLCGSIDAIGSKSVAHRALICAALFCDRTVNIKGITPSKDICATVGCLNALGANIVQGDVYVVEPIKKVPTFATLDCIESGSTLRFFLPIVSALGVHGTFEGSQRLFERPNHALIKVLNESGVSFENNKIFGQLKSGVYQIDASISSQYITGMLFALSLLHGDSELILVGECVSKEYIEITIDVLKEFGINIDKTECGYKIHGGAKSTLTEYCVEGDWSNAAFFLVAGAIGGDICMKGLNPSSKQGDKKIVDVLKLAGVKCSVAENVLVEQSNIKAFEVDAEQIPDMVPALCVLASYAHGESKITGVERLKIKESNRLDGVIDMLRVAGINATYNDCVLKIAGGTPKCGEFCASNDHRMAMSQTILALNANGVSKIIGAECVAKSYINFFEDVNSLGGGSCVRLERE